MKKKAIIIDLDGTLCDVEHRVHHVKGPQKNWNAFNESLMHDACYEWCFELIHAMKDRGYQILFVTGRSDDCRADTTSWLSKHNVQYDELYMRGLKDFREDSYVKEDLYKDYIEPHYKVLFVVDDRKSVVQRWRELGLTCLQCAPGDF